MIYVSDKLGNNAGKNFVHEIFIGIRNNICLDLGLILKTTWLSILCKLVQGL